METKQPPRDTRYKTEDVTNTKGLSFKDFGLSQELQLVNIRMLSCYLGNLRNGLRESLSYPRRSYPARIERLEHSREIQERHRKNSFLCYSYNIEN